jgi:hypothetical protein
MVNNGMYQTIGESLVRNWHDTILTPGTIASIANCVFPIIEIKVDLDDQQVHSRSSKPIQESTFVDFSNSFNNDGNFGSFLTRIMLMSKRLLFHKGQVNLCVDVIDFGKHYA